MAELRRDLDFPEEPVGAQGGGQLGPHHLDRHLAAVFEVGGQVDRGHPALAQHPLDGVGGGERLPHPGDLGDVGGRGTRGNPGLGGRGGPAVQAEQRLFGERRPAGRAGAGGGCHLRVDKDTT